MREAGESIINIGNDIKPSEAVFVYGIIAGVQAMVHLILFLTLARYLPWFLSSETIVYVLLAVWWPTFMAWIAQSILDNAIMREFLFIAVLASFVGPFFLYWTSLGDLLTKAVEM